MRQVQLPKDPTGTRVHNAPGPKPHNLRNQTLTNTTLSLQSLLLLLALTAGLTLAGCGSEPCDESLGYVCSTDDDDAANDDDSADDDDSAGTALANLSGSVTRSVDIADGQDGQGDLYLTILGEMPSATEPPVVITATMMPNVDLEDAGSWVAYLIEQVPTRAEAYFVIAMLDDDGGGPEPGPNDLLSFPTSITMDAQGDYTLDLALSMTLP
jgi:hypothetical protein